MKLGTKLGLLALVIAIASMAGWSYSIRTVDIPENRWLFIVSFLSALVLGVAAIAVKQRSWVGSLVSLPAIFLGMLLPYTIAISEQGLAEGSIEVGDTIPHFVSVDGSGNSFDSASLEGHLLLIKFFRAHW